MAIRYEAAHDVKMLVSEIVKAVGLYYILPERVLCVRSRGSESKRTIARIYGLPRIWQQALRINSHYVIEVISERYDSLEKGLKEKTIIHELLHIPKGFKGGLRHHKGWISNRKIEDLYQVLLEKRS